MGSSSGGGGGSGDSTNTVRYAPYVESKHSSFLTASETAGNAIRNSSPYASYTDIDYDEEFFGAGYTMASYPSLYDMYGKFMAGLDVETLWVQVLDTTQDNVAVTEMVQAHANLLDEEIEDTVLPRFQVGARDINAVVSSTFVIGKAVIERGRNRDVAMFDKEVRYKLIPVAMERWARHLAWNHDVINSYLQIMQLVINTKFAEDDRNFDFAARDLLWPFTVLDYERANIGALQGAISAKSSVGGASNTQRAIGGAISGAALGGAIGDVRGAVAGGILGLAASFF